MLIDIGMVEAIRPPLLREDAIFLPLRQDGERMRVLITEFETYDTGIGPNPTGLPIERIIFAEAVEM